MTLRVALRVKGSDGEPLRVDDFEVAADNALSFGRADGQNRIHIPDDKKMVSSRHGRIERRGNDYFVVDLGSTNGTLFNGRPVESDTGELLVDGGIVTVGDFELQVFLNPTGAPAGAAGGLDATMHGFDPDQMAAEAWDAACSRYVDGLRLPAAERDKLMRDELRARLRKSPPAQARAVLKRVAARTGGAAQDSEGGPAEELLQAGLKELQRLAKALVPERLLTKAADAARFGQLMDAFLQLTLRWIVHTMQGRAEFENQFGAEVTMVFQRSSNPLKGLTAKDLGRHLLDWTENRDATALRHQLETLYRDLTQHQLGLLVGVKEAIRAVMERLSPEAIEGLAQKDAGWLTSKGAKAWEVYREIYRDFLEERSKLFHEVISPAIRQGYLMSHQDDVDPKKQT